MLLVCIYIYVYIDPKRDPCAFPLLELKRIWLAADFQHKQRGHAGVPLHVADCRV